MNHFDRILAASSSETNWETYNDAYIENNKKGFDIRGIVTFHYATILGAIITGVIFYVYFLLSNKYDNM